MLLPNSPAAGQLHLLLSLAYLLSILLLVGGVLLALAQIVAVRAQTTAEKNIVARWWSELWADPARQGLVLLLLWQIASLLLLTRHSIVLFVHYCSSGLYLCRSSADAAAWPFHRLYLSL